MKTTIHYFTCFQSAAYNFELGHNMENSSNVNLFDEKDNKSKELTKWAKSAKLGEMHEFYEGVAVCVLSNQLIN